MRRTSRAAPSPSRPFGGATPDQVVQRLLQVGQQWAAVVPPPLDGSPPATLTPTPGVAALHRKPVKSMPGAVGATEEALS